VASEIDIGLTAMGAISIAVSDEVASSLSSLGFMVSNTEITKEQIVELVGSAIPAFQHIETGHNLDRRFEWTFTRLMFTEVVR
jgi:hypothetical protein